MTEGAPSPEPPGSAPEARPAPQPAPRRTPDTYWLLEGVTLLLIHALGGLYVQGEANVPTSGAVLMVSNHVSYLDPVSIGDASPRRVVFMAKAQLFENRLLGFLLRGVDAFPVRRGEPDRLAFKTTLAMLDEERVVCIFPEGTRSPDGTLQAPEQGAALFAMKAGCSIVPVFVSGTDTMLARGGRVHRAKITVAFGTPFTLQRGTDREAGGRRLMAAIAQTRDEFAGAPSRRIYPHWIKKPREGSRATPTV